MSEDITRLLPPFEERIIAAIADLRAEMRAELGQIRNELTRVDDRLTALEQQSAARSRETRPLWEAVLARLGKVDSKFDVLAADLLSTRADVDELKKRLPAA